MTRLIDADALHDSINKETYRHTYIEQIHSIIDNAPTIEILLCMDGKGTIVVSVRENGEILNEEAFDYCSQCEAKIDKE